MRDIGHTQFASITPSFVKKHPTWNMGDKICVDSATMMNKALEIIEVYNLFGIKNIDVLINKESLVHAILCYADNSITMHAYQPSMKVPIMYSLFGNCAKEDYSLILDYDFRIPIVFEEINEKKFPTISWGKELIGNRAKSIEFNAINNSAVAAFLRHEININDIFNLIKQVLACSTSTSPESIEDIDYMMQESTIISEEIVKKYIRRLS